MMSHSTSGRSQTLGIWRLLDQFHTGTYTDMYYAQPADAAGSPRADYVVKRLSENIDAQIEGKAQLLREAESIRSVAHPNVVAILDSRLTSNSPFIVMPRLEGQPLTTWLSGVYFQPLPVCLWWIRQAIEGLGALHRAGWVHGDVKPDNIMIGPRGHLTVIDLGLAAKCGSALNRNRFEGTPAYAAPERIRGADIATPDADIFSLGVVYYQMISRSREMPARFAPDFESLRKDGVPESMISLAERMLAAIPVDRPTASKLTEDIFKLEIETLGMHIQPEDDARAA